MEKQDGVDFLLVEYQKSIDLIQHYDNLRVSLMKFAFSYHSVVATVAFALYRYLYWNDNDVSNDEKLWTRIFISCSLLLASLIGMTTIFMLARNRKYFVYAARQANTMRAILFSRGDLASSVKSALPTNPDEPKRFKPKSPHLVAIFLLLVVNGVLLSIGVLFFAWTINLSLRTCWILTIICLSISPTAQFCLVKWILKEES